MVLSKMNFLKNNLQNSFVCCKNYLQTLFNVTFNHEDILQWFQGFCKHLTTLINFINSYYKEINEKTKNLSTIVFYLTQIITTLSLLINIFVQENENKLILVEVRNCVTKQIICCLESVEFALNNNQVLNDPSGNFVKWMDAALEKVLEINIHKGKLKTIDIFEETQQIFEEVLSHAMSIAQVSLSEDSRIIRGSCQSVLSTLKSLQTEINNQKTNPAMINLFIDACSYKLCNLEKKVNTAVLKLSLNVFSEFILPLEKIYSFCFNTNNREKIDEFDSLVADFDLHVDRIMQIGLFAVSCSSDISRGIKIRSCLASLEALESELVPAFNAVLLNNSPKNINCALILKKHWTDQASCLQQLIYLIIDPFAFCQIIYEKASQIVDSFLNDFRTIDVKNFVSIMEVLRSFLQQAQTEFNETEKNKVDAQFKNFTEVLDEVEKASLFLLSENKSIDNCKRVLKRCKILLTVVKRLWFCFADDSPLKINTKSKDKSESPRTESTGNHFLDHIINRGKQILQDRSVLYRTPVKNITAKNKSKFLPSSTKEIPLSKLVHMRKLCFNKSFPDKSVTTFDLQITDILNEVTTLSISLKGRNDTKTI